MQFWLIQGPLQSGSGIDLNWYESKWRNRPRAIRTMIKFKRVWTRPDVNFDRPKRPLPDFQVALYCIWIVLMASVLSLLYGRTHERSHLRWPRRSRRNHEWLPKTYQRHGEWLYLWMCVYFTCPCYMPMLHPELHAHARCPCCMPMSVNIEIEIDIKRSLRLSEICFFQQNSFRKARKFLRKRVFEIERVLEIKSP